jgi:hypothetical protein
MVAHRLVHLVQYHSGTLALSLAHQVQMSERAGSYRNVSEVELRDAVHEIYGHLGTWLLDKSECDIEERYKMIGARRAEQDVALHELVWVIILTKRNLWKYIEDVSLPGRVADQSDKQEMLELLDQFFDHAIHAAIVGYENAVQNHARSPRAASRIASKTPKAS